MMVVVGAVVMALSVGLVMALFTVPVPTDNRDMVNFSAGVVLGWGGAVVSFYFGSSKSSRDKDAAISAKAESQA